ALSAVLAHLDDAQRQAVARRLTAEEAQAWAPALREAPPEPPSAPRAIAEPQRQLGPATSELNRLGSRMKCLALLAASGLTAEAGGKWCSFVNEPRIPYFWDESCLVERSLGCWADGIHPQCRFCGSAPYLTVPCPDDAKVPDYRVCDFENEPLTPYYWEPRCDQGLKGCKADGKTPECRFCGEGDFAEILCPEGGCSFVNEPSTPYFWDTTCEIGKLGCNADGLHVHCRFCDVFPFRPVGCPPQVRPDYPTGECWFPQGTAQTYYWERTCQVGILGCLADGLHEQCRYCGPGSEGAYESIPCPTLLP
ncbi:unnamed protein product, partial [Effrenium voratum]